jgi:DNA-binding MarR family transcriptional regulator
MAPSDSTDQDDLVDALAQVSFFTMAVLTRVSAENDLSLTQLRTLSILKDRRLKMAELADYLGLDKSSMTGLIDRAGKRGLVERARHPTDGRSIDVFLTAEGIALADELHAQAAMSLAPTTSVLSLGDQNRLQALLQELLKGIERAR